MNKQMTIEEIESQFDSEWVLIEDRKTDENLKILGGKVVHHGKDRDKVNCTRAESFSRPGAYATSKCKR